MEEVVEDEAVKEDIEDTDQIESVEPTTPNVAVTPPEDKSSNSNKYRISPESRLEKVTKPVAKAVKLLSSSARPSKIVTLQITSQMVQNAKLRPFAKGMKDGKMTLAKTEQYVEEHGELPEITAKAMTKADRDTFTKRYNRIPTMGDPSNDKYADGFTAPETFDSDTFKLKLGQTPYPEKLEPTSSQVEEVVQRLQPWHSALGVHLDPQGRHLATDGELETVVTVDQLVRVLMAQATGNDNALLVQDVLKYRFPFVVDGKEVIGKVPNYHAMRLCSQEELMKVIVKAGLGTNRSFNIIYLLEYVYETNLALAREENGGELPKDFELGQPANVGEFVPGLLSLDRLKSAPEKIAWDYIGQISGMGLKSTACVLAFCLGKEVIAVDTHIRKMSLMLGWCPEGIDDPEKVFKHTSGRIPSKYKHLVHQLFWYHPQQCKRCKYRITTPVSKSASGDQVCPLEDLLDRTIGATGKERKAPKSIAEAEKAEEEEMAAAAAKELQDMQKRLRENASMKKAKEAKKGGKEGEAPTIKGKVVLDFVLRAALTDQEAAKQGLVLHRAPVDGDFGMGKITRYIEYWFKPKFWEFATLAELEAAAGQKKKKSVEQEIKAEN